MKPEQPHQMRIRILRELSAVQLPVYVGEDTPHEEMSAVNDMILDGWIEGSAMAHSRGRGFHTIQVVRIRECGLQALADSALVARAAKTAKHISIAAWKVIAGTVLIFGAVMAWLTYQQRQAQPLVVPAQTSAAVGPPSPMAATPAQPASAAHQPPSVSTPTPATPKP